MCQGLNFSTIHLISKSRQGILSVTVNLQVPIPYTHPLISFPYQDFVKYIYIPVIFRNIKWILPKVKYLLVLNINEVLPHHIVLRKIKNKLRTTNHFLRMCDSQTRLIAVKICHWHSVCMPKKMVGMPFPKYQWYVLEFLHII